MSSLLFLAIFCTLCILYFILGLLASRNVKTTSDYFLAGRDLGLLPVTFTLIATQLGGGMLLGTAQKAYSIGFWGILYTLGMSIGFLILGLGLAARLRSLNIATTAELFETVYQSPTLKKIASLLSVATMSGLLVAQMIASRALLNGLGVTSEAVFLFVWLSLILYIMAGGLRAVAVTDIAQVLVIIAVFGGIFAYTLLTEPAQFWTTIFSQPSTMNSPQLCISSLLPVILIPTLFSLIEQDLAQQFFASRTKSIAALAALFASIFLLLFSCVPIYFGIKARTLGLDIPMDKSPLMPVLSTLTNELVVALATCGILAAITSTATSVLCAASSNVAQDFDFSFLGIKNTLKLSQTVMLVIGLTALGASYIFPQDVIDIIISSYEISVSCLLIPLLASYYYPRLPKNAAIGALLGGIIGFIGFRVYPVAMPKEIATLVLSGIGFMIGLVSKK